MHHHGHRSHAFRGSSVPELRDRAPAPVRTAVHSERQAPGNGTGNSTPPQEGSTLTVKSLTPLPYKHPLFWKNARERVKYIHCDPRLTCADRCRRSGINIFIRSSLAGIKIHQNLEIVDFLGCHQGAVPDPGGVPTGLNTVHLPYGRLMSRYSFPPFGA
eukprot:gene8145-biopygen22597